jgi:hypothetical protein
MNKRQRKKARRKQIRIYTQHGAIPGPYRNIRQAIRLARRSGQPYVFRYEFQWRTIRWTERVTRAPGMWCVSFMRVTKDGVVRRSRQEALQSLSPLHFNKVVR